MTSKYAPLLPNSPGEDDLNQISQVAVKRRYPDTTTLFAIVLSLILYTLTVVAVTKDIIQSSEVDIPASSCKSRTQKVGKENVTERFKVPHPTEMKYVIQQTGQEGTPLHALAFDQPSPESDENWFALLERTYFTIHNLDSSLQLT